MSDCEAFNDVKHKALKCNPNRTTVKWQVMKWK